VPSGSGRRVRTWAKWRSSSQQQRIGGESDHGLSAVSFCVEITRVGDCGPIALKPPQLDAALVPDLEHNCTMACSSRCLQCGGLRACGVLEAMLDGEWPTALVAGENAEAEAVAQALYGCSSRNCSATTRRHPASLVRIA
jgi:hypothetical protein